MNFPRWAVLFELILTVPVLGLWFSIAINYNVPYNSRYYYNWSDNADSSRFVVLVIKNLILFCIFY